MNTLKVQQELLKALCTEGNQVRYFHLEADDEHIFVTVDGKAGYFIPESDLRIRITYAQMVMDSISDQIEKALLPSNRLTGTDEYRIGGTVRKYIWTEGGEEPVYFDTSLLKNFSNPELYKDRSHPKDFAVVTEHDINTGERKAVGIVMPYQIQTK